MKKGNQAPLEPKDVGEVIDSDSTKKIYAEFLSFRQSHPKWSMKSSLIFSLFPLFPLQLCLAVVCKLVQFIPTFLMFYAVRILRNSDYSKRLDAIWYFVYIFASSMFRLCAYCQVKFMATRNGLRLRALLVSLLFDKSLKRLIESQQEEGKDDASVGKIVTLMSSDVVTINWLIGYLHMYTVEPLLDLIVTFVGLYIFIGAASFGSLAAMCIMIPIGGITSKYAGSLGEKLMKATDSRVNAFSETLNSIKIIKYFGWEKHFQEKVTEKRNQELAVDWKLGLIQLMFTFIASTTGIILSLVTFGLHTILLKQTLTIEQAMIVLSLMSTLSNTLNFIAYQMTRFVKAGVSFSRILTFLDEGDIQGLKFKEEDGDNIGFQDASLTYSTNDEGGLGFSLRKVSAQILPNKLNVVVGPTAAGKSSLVLALLGGTWL